ncbi:MAG: hypothetical protein II458_04665 [Oscillospiraceae bacterium]|nr:hypothetical protein [Oscillospiraceae bacterium]
MDTIEKCFAYLYAAGKEIGIQCKGCGSVFLVPADSLKKDQATGHFSVLRDITCEQCGKVLTKEKQLLTLRELENIDAILAEEEEKAKREAEKRAAQERERTRQEQARIRRERAEQAAAARIEKAIKDAGGTWEYKVISLVDADSGSITPWELEQEMNELGKAGWHLRCAYTNEIGRTSTPGDAFGINPSTNATIEQNILIFERFIRLSE